MDSMECDGELGVYSTPCRCGGTYSLTEEDLEDGVGIVCCSSCSLSIRVLYQEVDEEVEDRVN